MKDTISVIYEDDYLLVVNKPARIASVPGEGIALEQTVLGMVQRFSSEQGREYKPYLLHRIDMQTSGLLMFGKHEKDRKPLEEILQAPDTQKKYLTLVKGIPSGKSTTVKLKARASNDKIFAKTNYKVITVYKILGTVVSLVEAEIETGRKHQIRQHFANMGCPVVMDSVYGDFAFNRKFRTTYRLGRQFLHSSSITFTHPFLKKEMKIEAPLSIDLQMVLEKIKK